MYVYLYYVENTLKNCLNLYLIVMNLEKNVFNIYLLIDI